MKVRYGKILLSLVVVSMLVCMTIPIASAPPPEKPCEPWPECKDDPGGEEPPADPAIAYQEAGGIWVMNADGARKTLVYPYSEWIFYPAWSPDGASIAFVQGGPGGGGPDYEIWAVDVIVVDGEAQGTNARMLADHQACGGAACRRPVWSPAGDQIAVEGIWFYYNPGIYMFPASGLQPGEQAELIYSGEGLDGAGQIAWKPDATQIAFWFSDRVGDLIADTWMVILDITQSPPVVVDTLLQGQFGSKLGVDWARTGDELIFSAVPTGGDTRAIYRMDIATGVPIEIVSGEPGGNGPDRPAWSPDDSQMVYRAPAQIAKGKKGQVSGIIVYDFATGDKTVIGTGFDPDWSRS
jgi:Tol biopolymer transport system component